MKRTALAVCIYVGALLLACVLAGLSALLFLRPGDLPVGLQALILAVASGLGVVAFMPFVVVAQVALRRLTTHRLVPLFALPVFGAGFSVLGFLLHAQMRWWPDGLVPVDAMDWVAVLLLAVFALGVGGMAAFVGRGMLEQPAARR